MSIKVEEPTHEKKPPLTRKELPSVRFLDATEYKFFASVLDTHVTAKNCT